MSVIIWGLLKQIPHIIPWKVPAVLDCKKTMFSVVILAIELPSSWSKQLPKSLKVEYWSGQKRVNVSYWSCRHSQQRIWMSPHRNPYCCLTHQACKLTFCWSFDSFHVILHFSPGLSLQSNWTGGELHIRVCGRWQACRLNLVLTVLLWQQIILYCIKSLPESTKEAFANWQPPTLVTSWGKPDRNYSG